MAHVMPQIDRLGRRLRRGLRHQNPDNRRRNRFNQRNGQITSDKTQAKSRLEVSGDSADNQSQGQHGQHDFEQNTEDMLWHKIEHMFATKSARKP